MTLIATARRDHPLSEGVTEADAQYAKDLVSRICREVGPGVPGSRQERQRAEIIRRELAQHLGEKNVLVEEFVFAPAACLSAFPASAVLMLVAALLNTAIGRVPTISPWMTAIGAVTVATTISNRTTAWRRCGRRTAPTSRRS
jgi:hypothetical protein